MEYKCEVCGHGKYLVFVMSVKDMVCEGCGAWQDAEFNDIWERGR
jgi:ribosomal protein S27E